MVESLCGQSSGQDPQDQSSRQNRDSLFSSSFQVTAPPRPSLPRERYYYSGKWLDVLMNPSQKADKILTTVSPTG